MENLTELTTETVVVTTPFDTSKHLFINDIWLVRDTPQIIIKLSIFVPVVLFGIFGNILSIYILIKNPHIRTPANLLIGNMAVADLLSVLLHPWIFLIYDFFQNYQLGPFVCRTEAAVECSILIASVISLSVISYDRLTAIVLPKETRLNKKGAKIVMAVTWIIGFIIASPIFYYRSYQERQWKDFLEIYCAENALVINIYWHVILTVLFWLPLSIQLICYISIFLKLKKYEKVVTRHLDNHQVNYKKKAAQMMFAMITTFMICRLPFTALIIYRKKLLERNYRVQNQVTSTDRTLLFVSKLLIFVNTALNPLIYGMTNERFRRGFQTTKLSKWLFPPPPQKRIVIKPQLVMMAKSQETSSTKKNVFFIFKRKQKSSTYEVDNSGVVLPQNEKKRNTVKF